MMRLCYNALVLFSIIALPFWITAILLLFGLFLFARYAEAVLFGMMLDLLFGAGAVVQSFSLGMGVLALVGLGVSELIRAKIRPAGRRSFGYHP